jgi:hypothetical protein
MRLSGLGFAAMRPNYDAASMASRPSSATLSLDLTLEHRTQRRQC